MDRRIKILFTIPNFITAGSGREMYNIISRLDKEIFDISIGVEQKGGSIYDELVAHGYTVIEGDFRLASPGSVWSKIKKAKQLAKIYKPYGFDIWQSFHWSSDYTEALIARFAGATYVYVKKNMNWDRMAWRVKSYLADAIVARNTTMRDTYFAHMAFRHKAIYIPGAVDAEIYTRNGDMSLRVELNIAPGAFVLSCVAQIVRVKDQATVIKATATLNNVWLVLAGAPTDEIYAEELKVLVQDLGISERVIFTQISGPVKRLLEITDAFVLPTSKAGGHEEGCPVALMEAMSMEVPCIASNVAGSKDLIRQEQTGLLFEPGDEAALASCIKKCMTQHDEVRKYTVNARREITALYTLDMEAKRFSELYKQLLTA